MKLKNSKLPLYHQLAEKITEEIKNNKERVSAYLDSEYFSNENIFMCGQVMLYSDRKQVFVGETEISLTLKEYQLLEYFIMNQNQVLTKEMIMENIWGIDSEFIDPNTISVMISRLKKKLNDSSNVISNVFGMGYRMGE